MYSSNALANIYREEKNILDLYVILIRFSSLVSETIPCHRDYQTYPPREKTLYRKKLLDVLDELESLKAEAQCLMSKLNEARAVAQLPQLESLIGTSNGLATSSLEWPLVNNKSSSLSARQVAMVEKCTTVLQEAALQLSLDTPIEDVTILEDAGLQILTKVSDQKLGRCHGKVVRCMGKMRVCDTGASFSRSTIGQVIALTEEVATLKGQLVG